MQNTYITHVHPPTRGFGTYTHTLHSPQARYAADKLTCRVGRAVWLVGGVFFPNFPLAWAIHILTEMTDIYEFVRNNPWARVEVTTFRYTCNVRIHVLN